jgi:hypothetical protein
VSGGPAGRALEFPAERERIMDLQPVPLSELQEVFGGSHHKNDDFSLVASYNQPPNNGPYDGGLKVVTI